MVVTREEDEGVELADLSLVRCTRFTTAVQLQTFVETSVLLYRIDSRCKNDPH